MKALNNIIVITPIYEDREASIKLFQELAKSFHNKITIVAIDDGSVQQVINIANIEQVGLQGIIIKLKRNVGHQGAIAIGLHYVADNFKIKDSQRVVIMDSDGEDIPESIQNLIEPLNSKDIDIVVAKRKNRIETMWFHAFYIAYKLIFRILTGKKINFGNFMALKYSAIKRLVSMQELWIHIASCVLNSKLRLKVISLNRGPRYTGKSKMNFTSLVLHGFKGIMVFAENVLVRVSIFCIFVAVLSIFSGVMAIVLKIFGFATPGWFSTVLGILLLVFLQTGTLALMTLMLTGVIKPTINYKEFIDSITRTK